MSTTPTLREAAQAILDALAFRDAAVFSGDRDKVKFGADKVYEAADDLRAALAQAADAGAAEPVAEHYRNAIAEACEGWTMSEGLRKHLETALWNPPPALPALQLQQAVARALDKAADFICSGPPPVKVEGGHIEIGKRARRAYAAAIRQQGTP